MNGLLGSISRHVVLGLLAFVMTIPFLWMLSTSLKSADQVSVFPPVFIPHPLQWSNFRDVWLDVPFGRYLVNSALVSGVVTLLELITASLAAFAFARLRFRGRDALFFLYLATLMIPGQVTIVPNFVLMRMLGWLDSYFALIIPAAFTASGTFLLRQYFLTIPRELDLAARIDGCGPFGVYGRIILPLATPAIATMALFAFVAQWNAFLWPLVVTNSESMRTVAVGLRFLVDSTQVHFHLLMAAALLSTLPTIVLFAALQNAFVRGIALTGLGGR